MWSLGFKKKSRKRRKRKKKSFFSRLVAVLFFILRLLRIPAVLVAIFILSGLLWLKHAGYYEMVKDRVLEIFNFSQVNSGMVLENILLDGHKYTPKEQILSAVKGQNSDEKIYIGYPIMKIDLWEIKDNLEKLTWIKHAYVTRQLPSTLSISVEEREPMALWQNDGKVLLIDNDGEVIHEPNISRFSDLIILVGKNVPFHAAHLLKMISKDKQIGEMISSGTLVNGRRWNISLKSGITIKLPEENPEYAWDYLINKQHESKLLESEVKTIDMRIEKKMFVN